MGVIVQRDFFERITAASVEALRLEDRFDLGRLRTYLRPVLNVEGKVWRSNFVMLHIPCGEPRMEASRICATG